MQHEVHSVTQSSRSNSYFISQTWKRQIKLHHEEAVKQSKHEGHSVDSDPRMLVRGSY